MASLLKSKRKAIEDKLPQLAQNLPSLTQIPEGAQLTMGASDHWVSLRSDFVISDCIKMQLSLRKVRSSKLELDDLTANSLSRHAITLTFDKQPC